ncbi:hypothetical protein NF865_10275 [Thermococcus aggregans]|uniref:Uncharacterized protein n=1 Tax=Thermococcus aggregans TaxID=110163 RepID=A0A9E7MXC9_THEAG|nr:hypothetical protein [Thermococcus aggregans]USS40649.1 hypothetical protein NF865_10275 [Thermococcus aggregans]
MGEVRLAAVVLILILLSSGCLGVNSTMSTSQEEALYLMPGYGEFNAGNILFNLTDEHERLEENLAFLMPPNSTIEIKGLLFAKKYSINQKECYYKGKAKLSAFLGDSNTSNSWSYLQSRLKRVENISVEIVPKETTISENKNATFEIIIKTENVKLGETYHIYIVAFGEDGWKAWARIEVKIWGLEETSH